MSTSKTLKRIGWREWIHLPDLGISRIKAKIDTGARTSSLHAFDFEVFSRRGVDMVRFKVHPLQRNTRRTVEAEAPLVDLRRVRNSGGAEDERLVIHTTAELMGVSWPIEVTLARRDVMGFRMLLGRQAIRHRFVVDPGRSYYAGKPKRRSKRSKGGTAS